MDFVSFGIIIDDIVSPDGHTTMGQLGGGGPQTTFGMRLWTEQVGLVAGVGTDLPEEAQAWLAQAGIDTAGLRLNADWPTLRAWQLYEADGRRTQIWRTPESAVAVQLGHAFAQIPPSYQTAQGFHAGVHPEEPDEAEFIQALRQHGAVVSVETYRHASRLLNPAELHRAVSAGHIFSPNLLEVETMVGAGEPQELVRRLIEAGAEIVALRLGEDGALIQRADSGEMWHIPAYPTTAVDPTGAGNAFCGGFLAGWVHHQDICLAGVCGAVSASFLVEQVGLPPVTGDWQAEARRRFETLKLAVRQI